MPARSRKQAIPQPRPRTQTGARLVEVAEVDPVAERDMALSRLYADYNEIADAAFADYLTDIHAAADRWQARLGRATDDYNHHVERLRMET